MDVTAGVWAVPQATFQRPNDTADYASGDLVADTTSSGSVTPMTFQVHDVPGGGGMIRRVRLAKTGTSTSNAQFRLHLYTSTMALAGGDNAPWLTNLSTGYYGAMDVTCDKTFSDGAQGVGVPNNGGEIAFKLGVSGQSLYGLLEARAAYNPSSRETFSVRLEVAQS